MLLAWTLACGGDQGTTPSSTTADTAETDTPVEHSGTTAPVSVTCVEQPDNALRQTCGVRVHPPAPVRLSWARTDGLGAVREAVDDTEVVAHTLDVVFLAPEQAYAWTLTAPDDPDTPLATGTFTTGPLPREARVQLETLSGTSTAPYLGMSTPCTGGATAVIVETATSEVVWYQALADGPTFLEGVAFTEEHTVLGIDGDSVQEVDLAGNEVLRITPQDLGRRRVHHDVFRRDGLTYVLYQQAVALPSGSYLLDGFLVHRGREQVASWFLGDHITPSIPSPGQAIDWSHANAVWADEQGNVLFSLRGQSAVLSIDGRWGTPEGGQIRWILAAPDSELDSDLALASDLGGPADFDRQHNPWLMPDGRLTMFDNRPPPEASRIIDLRVDEVARTATIERAYTIPSDAPAGGHCDYQGSSWRTPDGRPLATCAPVRTAYEFDPDTAEVTWSAEARCDGGSVTYIPRFVPLDW
ncbi:MAG: aryl-sulfate sulfotransferase [Myxococcales bacterium]|nr:aryl-sulfate sulfotransferase [Myxococcales bacterium]